MHLRGWGNVMGSGAVATCVGIAVKQMDDVAGDGSMLIGKEVPAPRL